MKAGVGADSPVGAGAAGADSPVGAAAAGAASAARAHDTSALRIVSLLASGTEIVAALGLQDQLVGISHECDWPPDVLDRPRVSRPRFDPAGLSSGEIDSALRQAMSDHGSVYVVDERLLTELRPDIILTQAVCEVCAVPTAGVRDAVQRCGLDAVVASLDAHSIGDILDSIEQVARAAHVQDRAADVIAQLGNRIDAVRLAVRAAARPRVLALEWLDPPFAPGHWVPEMIEVAGGTNVVGSAGARSTQLTWPELHGLDPDVLVIMPCGYDLDATRRDADAAAERLHDVAPRALAAGHAWIVDGSAYFNRSGPRFVAGIEILATILHGDRCHTPLDGVAQSWPAGPRPIQPYQSQHC